MIDPSRSDEQTPAGEHPTAPRPLGCVERWMQAVITNPAGVVAGIDSVAAKAEIPIAANEIERVIAPSKALGSIERLGVYANAYYARLLECMREVFPVVGRTMGDEIFDHFTISYLQKYPSETYTLNELGARFARFLEETRPTEADEASATDAGLSSDWPQFVVELARLEWTVGEIYDGPGMEKRAGLTAEDLAAIPADRWLDARLELAPCVRLLKFRFPVNDYYARVRHLVREDDEGANDEETAIPSPEETYLALSRRNYVVWRYPISRPQFDLLSALGRGETIAAALAAASSNCDLDDEDLAAALHDWFAKWTADQFFAGVSLDRAADVGQVDLSL